ncbi:hypothetical protein JB92DRAFT_3115462 [Gautieria morchelliformis]|nr:hypothetical protein JB92DRAFT_3115462 [Gautieria morchelliformis]
MATSTSTSLDNSSITSPPASSSAATAIPPQNDASTSSGLSAGLKGAIAGGSVGGVLLVVLLALLFMSYRRGRRYRKEAEATKMIRSQSSRDMSQLTRLDLNDDAHSYYPPHTAAQLVDVHRSQGSMSVAGSLEPESTTSPSFNVRDLAAEIAKNIRQEMNPQDHTGPQQDGTSLATVPEQVVEKAVSRAELARRAEATRGPESTSGVESTRGSESTRGTEYTRRTESVRGRQLPRPPTRADVRSVDTLPAYAPGPR